ncbi:MFS transporter [Novosphingobium sp. G106]|uniref:MFS transporter n=1 Tax=Novosphingobium sp. G106 TaxID=2849500 RepID=UPI001C2D8F9E|nr:MFS transporter [Novosphingobium sp. G106]MBV1688343.1 MFS transporter [Novosphingobium sp. G106]
MMDQAQQAATTAPGLSIGEKVVVLMGGVVAGMSLTVLNPVLPSIEKALAHTPTDQMLVKQLFGAVTLAMVAGAPLGGFLVAKLGMRRLLLIASLVFAIGGSSGFFMSSLPMLLVSRLFVGLSAACIQVMALTLVNTRLSGAGRAKWMGLHVAIATLFSLAIFPLSGFLGDISWRLPFLEHLFGLVVFAAILVSPLSEVPQQPRSAAAGLASESIFKWMPWHYVALTLFTGAITFLPTIYSPFLFRDKFGLQPSGIGMIMLASALIGGLSAMFYGKAMRYLSVHAAFLVAFGLAATGMLIAALAASLPVMVGGFILYGLGNAWFVPNVMTSLGGKVLPHQQARAAGLVKMGQFLSTPLCVLLVEPYARQFGAYTVMLLACGMASFIFLLMLGRMITLGKNGLAAPAQVAGH